MVVSLLCAHDGTVCIVCIFICISREYIICKKKGQKQEQENQNYKINSIVSTVFQLETSKQYNIYKQCCLNFLLL